MKLRGVAAWLAAAFLVAVCGGAVAETATDLFAGFQARSNDPVQVNAEALEVYEEGKQRISVFSGNVVVTRGNTRLEAATITLYSDLAATSVGAFTRIEAAGGVFVKSNDQTVSGKTAVVNMDTRTITVSGGVVLSQSGNVLTGSRLVVNLATGRARLEGGQVRGLFTPASPPQVGQ
jgi:lipopolysaccharide export system protein LptA